MPNNLSFKDIKAVADELFKVFKPIIENRVQRAINDIPNMVRGHFAQMLHEDIGHQMRNTIREAVKNQAFVDVKVRLKEDGN